MDLRESFRLLSRAVTRSLAAAAVGCGAASGPVLAEPACDMNDGLLRMDYALPHVAETLALRHALTIVAMGSSSTAGWGTTAPDKPYPARLQFELSRLFPGATITVINKGVGGNELADMLKRFDADIVALKPDLVVWQLDTNSVVRNKPLDGQPGMIREGLRKIRAIGADVVLIDPQYALDVITKSGAQPMVDLIARTAHEEKVDVFRRFALMRGWVVRGNLGFGDFTIPQDNLHMNDWGHRCMAQELGAAIADAVRRPVIMSGHGSPAP